MKRLPLVASTIFALVAAFLAVTPAQAQATRTWVSGVGSDSNPCSRTAPCKTFAGAYGLTAAGGEIDAMDAGGFGTLTIGKSITIDGGGGQVASVLASGTPGITISGPAIVVTLRNLSLQGILSGNIGVNVVNAARVSIENCNIQGFSTYGIEFDPTVAGSKLTVTNSVIHDNGGYGVVMLPVSSGTAGLVTLDNDEIVHNGVGMYVGDNTWANATRTNISSNGSGVTVATSVTLAVLELDASSVSANSGNGLFLSFGGGHPIVRLSNSNIVTNTGNSMVIPSGGDVVTYGNNRIVDNGTDTFPNSSGMLR